MNNDTSNANVVKNNSVISYNTELTTTERIRLTEATTGHGRLKIALSKMRLNPLTVRRAAAGMKIKHESANKIRTFLNSL